MKTSFFVMKRALMVLLCAGCGLFMVTPKPAHAQFYVNCSTNGFIMQCASENYLTGVMHPLNIGNGLIPLLVEINGKLAQSNASEAIALSNEALVTRYMEGEKMMIENVHLRRAPSTSHRDCFDVSMSMGRAGAGAQGRATSVRLAQETLERYNRNVTPRTALAERVARRAGRYCTAKDKEERRAGCAGPGVAATAAGDDPMVGADIHASSLSRAPVGKDEKSNVSYTRPQVDAVNDYIQNLSPRDVSHPSEQARSTAAGRQAMAVFNIYQARLSTVPNALVDQVAFRTSMTGETPPPANSMASRFLQGWNDGATRAKYLEIFPGEEFPESPSEFELLRFSLYSQYADASSIAESKVNDTVELARRQLEVSTIQGRLSLEILARLDKLVTLQAASFAHQLDPLSRAEMLRTLESVGANPVGSD